MSFLNSYRLNFWGGFSTNVCTSNNSNTVINPITGMLSSGISGKTDEEIIADLKAGSLESGWNYMGDYGFFFQKANISSAGAPNQVTESGDVIGQPLFLLGSTDPNTDDTTPIGSPVMIDVDATGTSCTIISVGGLFLGPINSPLLKINHNTRCYSRDIGGRVIGAAGFASAAAMWQVAFPYEPDQWEVDESNAEISALMSEVKQAKGIVVSFSTFEATPKITTAQLLAKFAAGEAPSNPALGYTIGSIGVWYEDEYETLVPGRLLTPTDSNVSGCNAYALLNEQDNLLSIDLSNAIMKQAPRSDSTDNTGPISPNVDPGLLSLHVSTDTSLSIDMEYDATNYYKTGGIVDVMLDSNQVAALKGGNLSIQANGSEIMSEQTYRIESDARGVYLDPSATKTLQYRIRKWGQPLTQDEQVKYQFSASGSMGSTPNVILTNQDGSQISTDITPQNSENVTFIIDWLQGGLIQLNIQDLSNSTLYYMVLRTYPEDDYSSTISQGNITWDFIYEEILRYYYVVFPAMSLRFPLNDEQTITALGGEIIKRTGAQYHDTTLCMPITRTMSPGKIELLKSYLDEQSSS